MIAIWQVWEVKNNPDSTSPLETRSMIGKYDSESEADERIEKMEKLKKSFPNIYANIKYEKKRVGIL